ncbi:MAG: biopolymer transporter ExbD, partial [Roseibacillus sp.]
MASKRLRSVQSGDGDDLKIDMSPMIDMVFLLLIFFLVNATLIIVEMDKKIMVPIAKYSTKQSDKLGRIVINVYNDEDAAEGRFRQASGKDIFKDDADMVDWIKKQKEMWDDR